jgi:hypothetical protein
MKFAPRTPTLLALAASGLFTGHARAQAAADKAGAVQLFDEGDRLMRLGKTAEACPKYAASMKLDPQLGALLHLADCYAKAGKLASAWGSFREAEEMARLKGDERAALAKEQAAKLEPRLSHLMLMVPSAHPSGLEVRVDGTPLTEGVWGTATPIDPGPHQIEARAPDFETWSSTFEASGDSSSIRVEVPALVRSTTAPASPRPGDALPPPAEGGSSSLRPLGWAGIGLGAVGLGLGAVFLVKKNDKLDERDQVCPSRLDCTSGEEASIATLTADARNADTLEKVAFITGGVLAVGGITALILAPSSRAKADTAWLSPVVTARILGVTGGMTF